MSPSPWLCSDRRQRAGVFARPFEHPAQLVMTREHGSQVRRKRGDRLSFPRQQVLKESRRPTHRLARVVENVVEARQPLGEKSREQLHARRVAQIQPVDLQPLPKRREIRLSRIAVGGIDRKARRDDDMRPGAQ